jgi:hypothetical protein
MLGLPCAHLLCAFAKIGCPELPYGFVDQFWTMEAQRELYHTALPAIGTNVVEEDGETTALLFTPTGSRRKKRIRSAGEIAVPASRQRKRKTLAGKPVGAAEACAGRAETVAAAPGSVAAISNGKVLVQRPGAQPHVVDVQEQICDCTGFKQFGACIHIRAAAIVPPQKLAAEMVETESLRRLLQ